jgi:tetratricopeptide (TPR) repeat protein
VKLVGAAVAVILIGGIVLQYLSGRETRASEALSEVRVPLDPRTPLPPGVADALTKVAQAHSGTKAAARALVMAGTALYSENNFAQAQDRFSQLLRDYPNSPWVADAHLGVGACLEAQGKLDDATKKYEDIRKRFATSPVADDAKLALGRLYEKSNPEEAFRLYDELIKAVPQGGMSAEAGLRQEELVKARPELEKLRAPVTPPQPVQPQITMITNRPAASTNVVSLTNRPAGSNQPIQIKLTPTPAPAAGTPAPKPAPAK